MPHSSVLRHFFEFDHLFPSAKKYIWENYRFLQKYLEIKPLNEKELNCTLSLSLMG